jgi:hypothetical protein
VIDLERRRSLPSTDDSRSSWNSSQRSKSLIAEPSSSFESWNVTGELLDRFVGEVDVAPPGPARSSRPSRSPGPARERDDAGRALARDEQRRPLLCAGLRIDHVEGASPPPMVRPRALEPRRAARLSRCRDRLARRSRRAGDVDDDGLRRHPTAVAPAPAEAPADAPRLRHRAASPSTRRVLHVLLAPSVDALDVPSP